MKHVVIRMPEHESANCRMVVWYDKDAITMMELWSYNTHVATYFPVGFCSEDGRQHYSDTIEIYWGWSATTAKHIAWFKKYIGQKIYLSKWGNCWQGDCSKAKAIKASVYNPIRLTLKEVYD